MPFFSSFARAQEGQQSESRNRNNEIVQDGRKSAKIHTDSNQAAKFEEERLGSEGRGRTWRIIKVLFENITRRFEKDANDPQCHSIQDSDLNLTRPTLAQERPAASERATPFPDPFDDPLTIPYIRNQEPVYFYQHAEQHINPLHARRFRGIVNIFQTSIESNPKLAAPRDWIEKVTYSLAMCGTNIANAKESIIIFCPRSDGLVRQLILTLSQKHILDQYACGHVNICYRLYIWRDAYQYIGETEDSVTILFNKQQSLCGSPVTDVKGKARLSTVACIICVDSELYALTSAHSFKHRAKPEDNPDLPIDTILSRNVKYRDRLRHCKVLEHPSQASGKENFDWSLVTLPRGMDIRSRVNPLFAAEPQESDRDIHYIYPMPREYLFEKRKVRIILSYNTESRGFIDKIPVYMSSIRSSRGLCEIWTISQTHGRRLQTGDSGSLVIDEETDKAYGHVIALDPIGRILVVPLVDTLNQIQDMFQTPNVDLYTSFPPHEPIRSSKEPVPGAGFFGSKRSHTSWISKLFERAKN
ncbi:hypothetical protein F4774DRAFT_427633 [Daldinia eschscholtzii]|nr:hypothetical protein F4774DRAFT_427633 [Daldinia eschscholtzii]